MSLGRGTLAGQRIKMPSVEMENQNLVRKDWNQMLNVSSQW
jgi:hypothetical protein